MGEKKIRRKFVCISSCTLALSVGGFSGPADVHFGCGFDLLSDLKTHAQTYPAPRLTASPFLTWRLYIFFFSRGFNVSHSHSSSETPMRTHAPAHFVDCKRHLHVIGAVGLRCSVGSCRHWRPPSIPPPRV